jgi:hypothetical protein
MADVTWQCRIPKSFCLYISRLLLPNNFFFSYTCHSGHLDRLCGLVVRVPGYKSRGPGFDYRRYQIFWEVVGLERGPLSLVRTIEELLEWKSSGSGQENRNNGRGIRCADHATPSIRKKLALTSPTSGGRSVGIVRLRTKGHGVFQGISGSIMASFKLKNKSYLLCKLLSLSRSSTISKILKPWSFNLYLGKENAVFWDVTPCRYIVNQRFGGTSVHNRSIRHHIPEDSILHSHCRENLTYYNVFGKSRFEYQPRHLLSWLRGLLFSSIPPGKCLV